MNINDYHCFITSSTIYALVNGLQIICAGQEKTSLFIPWTGSARPNRSKDVISNSISELK